MIAAAAPGTYDDRTRQVAYSSHPSADQLAPHQLWQRWRCCKGAERAQSAGSAFVRVRASGATSAKQQLKGNRICSTYQSQCACPHTIVSKGLLGASMGYPEARSVVRTAYGIGALDSAVTHLTRVKSILDPAAACSALGLAALGRAA